MTREGWRLERPVPLEQVSLSWVDEPPVPTIRGDEDESAP